MHSIDPRLVSPGTIGTVDGSADPTGMTLEDSMQEGLLEQRQADGDDDELYDIDYLVVALPQGMPADRLVPGLTWKFKGLSSDAPVLKLPSGETLRGRYEQSLGTQMIFEPSTDDKGQSHAKYKCMTQQVLTFDDETNANIYKQQLKQLRQAKVFDPIPGSSKRPKGGDGQARSPQPMPDET